MIFIGLQVMAKGFMFNNGKTIKHITDKDGLCSNFVWKIAEDIHGNIWFETCDGVCNFDGKDFTNYTNTIYHKLNYSKGELFFDHLDGYVIMMGNCLPTSPFAPDIQP